jgi:hypothetical protein
MKLRDNPMRIGLGTTNCLCVKLNQPEWGIMTPQVPRSNPMEVADESMMLRLKLLLAAGRANFSAFERSELYH